MINMDMKIQEATLQQMITQLLRMCQRELELDDLPPIEIADTTTVGGDSSFGVYDGTIKVVATGRHPIDVCRTIAHELVHWKQNCEGMEMDGNDGSDTENQANALAGVIMRKFGKMYPEYFLRMVP